LDPKRTMPERDRATRGWGCGERKKGKKKDGRGRGEGRRRISTEEGE